MARWRDGAAIMAAYRPEPRQPKGAPELQRAIGGARNLNKTEHRRGYRVLRVAAFYSLVSFDICLMISIIFDA
jgi:hypothetical protein